MEGGFLMSGTTERWLGPGEAAAKLGVTVKALRVYEREGLVTPDRTAGQWRAYGPAQIARIHMILVLRELGLSLKGIREVLDGKALSLSALLTAQQDALEQRRSKIADAIEHVRAARLRIAQGPPLSMDDFIHLSRETVMEDTAMSPETKAGLRAHLKANVPAENFEAFKATWKPELAAADTDMLKAEIKILFAEMTTLAEIGDTNSEAAKAAMLRWKKVTAGFSRPKPEVAEGLNKGWDKALKDGAIAPQLPIDQKVTTYMRDVAANMRANGELD
jgi:DNA-binding transcriptional MerR regulator